MTVRLAELEAAATLALLPAEAAHHLGVREEEVLRLLATAKGAQAWERGRALGRRALHRWAIEAAQGGTVAAMRFLDELYERQEIAVSETLGQVEDVQEETEAAQEPPQEVFRLAGGDLLRRELRRRSSAG